MLGGGGNIARGVKHDIANKSIVLPFFFLFFLKITYAKFCRSFAPNNDHLCQAYCLNHLKQVSFLCHKNYELLSAVNLNLKTLMKISSRCLPF